MLGFIIGAISGAVQIWLLGKYTSAAVRKKSGRKRNPLLFVLSQFFLPFAVLLLCTILLSESLMWTGIGMAVSLVAGAIIRFMLFRR